MIEYLLMVIAVIGCILALMQRDLLKAAILTGIT
jgi:energy-converting hydrogenase B subunit D